jgi:hypothetical protein
MGRLSAQHRWYLDSWAGPENGEEVYVNEHHSLPKGVNSRLRVEIYPFKFGSARKGSRPLRQLHALKRFLSLYSRQPVRARSGSPQEYPELAF